MNDLITVILLAVAILEVRVRYLWDRFLREIENGKNEI